jgi:hypothetical protein
MKLPAGAPADRDAVAVPPYVAYHHAAMPAVVPAVMMTMPMMMMMCVPMGGLRRGRCQSRGATDDTGDDKGHCGLTDERAHSWFLQLDMLDAKP